MLVEFYELQKKNKNTSISEITSLESLMSSSYVLKYEPGEIIFHKNQVCNHFYEVVNGTLAAFTTTETGKRQFTELLFEADLIGYENNHRYNYSVAALNRIELKLYPIELLNDLMERSPLLLQRLLDKAFLRIEAKDHHLFQLSCMTARQAVVEFIFTLMKSPLYKPNRIELPMNRYEIADYLGLTIETVSRNINELKREGCINFSNSKSLEITDLPRLQEKRLTQSG